MLTNETKNFTLWDNQNKKKIEVEAKKIGKEWRAFCPFHSDKKTPNLSIDPDKNDGVYYCFACGAKGQLFNPQFTDKKKTIEEIYSYKNEEDKLIFQVVRYDSKDFRQRRPDGQGGYIWNLSGVKRVIYNLPEILKKSTKPVFIVEGEKDCNNLEHIGILATTNSGGAGKWRAEYNQYFKDREVILIPDNDEVGINHAQEIGKSLKEIAKSIKFLTLPGLENGEDVSDWLERGGNLEKLFTLVKTTPAFSLSEIDKALEVPIKEISQKKLDILLEKAIPDKGFLRHYIDLFSEISDCPKSFLFWGAMTTIATILGKDIFVNWEARKLYPNIWCVFLAPSGFRKGTGIDFPVKILKEIDLDLLLPTIGSEEGLTKSLDISKSKGREIGLIRWQEFARILSSWDTKKRSWQASKEFFIDIFDSKSFKKKLSNEEYNIGETAISFMGACIPASFNKYFNIEDLDSGFFGRVYLITVKEKRKYFSIPPAVDSTTFNRLASELRAIRELYQDQAISYSEIKEIFNDWATDIYRNRELGYLDSFFARIETHCIKLAMIYEACLSGGDSISKESFNYAVNALNFLVESARVMVSETIGLNEEQKIIQDVENYIRKRKKVFKKDISIKFKLRWDYLTNIIEETLVNRNSIIVESASIEKGSGAGRPQKIYIAIG